MHLLNFDTRTVRVVLEPSAGYTGPISTERYVCVYLYLLEFVYSFSYNYYMYIQKNTQLELSDSYSIVI